MESSCKNVRGKLTEGRYLTFERDGLALAVEGKDAIKVSSSNHAHNDIHQRWIVKSTTGDMYGTSFYIQSALLKTYITNSASLDKDQSKACKFTVEYNAKGATYTITPKSTTFFGKAPSGLSNIFNKAGLKIFSVSYPS